MTHARALGTFPGETPREGRETDSIGRNKAGTFGVAIDDSPFAGFLANNRKPLGSTITLALEHTQQQVVGATNGS